MKTYLKTSKSWILIFNLKYSRQIKASLKILQSFVTPLKFQCQNLTRFFFLIWSLLKIPLLLSNPRPSIGYFLLTHKKIMPSSFSEPTESYSCVSALNKPISKPYQQTKRLNSWIVYKRVQDVMCYQLAFRVKRMSCEYLHKSSTCAFTPTPE